MTFDEKVSAAIDTAFSPAEEVPPATSKETFDVLWSFGWALPVPEPHRS